MIYSFLELIDQHCLFEFLTKLWIIVLAGNIPKQNKQNKNSCKALLTINQKIFRYAFWNRNSRHSHD